jgi:hypothetical protein
MQRRPHRARRRPHYRDAVAGWGRVAVSREREHLAYVRGLWLVPDMT